MTENEAKIFLEAYLKCKNKEDAACYGKGCDKNCDECDLLYMQGTSGQHKEVIAMAINALEEVQQYRAIGTVEECREAVEKQKAKRPDGGRDIEGNDYLICPNCCAIVADGEWVANFCPDCGQKLDWGGEE